MTQLTRTNFVDELKLRGWSRFSDASLIRYLDWALQDVYRQGKFESVKDTSVSGTLADGDYRIAFASVGAGAGTEIKIHAVNAVIIKDPSGSMIPLEPAIRERFWDEIFPNSQQSSGDKVKGRPQFYYIYGEDIHLWPASDGVYDWFVHYTARADVFAGAGNTSGLPERMDSAILAAAEVQCNKRARDVNGMAVAESVLNGLINGEIANEKRQFTEEAPRIGRYEH